MQLLLRTDEFNIKECKPAFYKDRKLNIQIVAEAKSAGEKIIKIGLDSETDFYLTGADEHILKNNFLQQVKLISIEQKDTAPLRKAVPFNLKVNFETPQSISQEIANEFCRQLIIHPDKFIIKGCNLTDYKDNILNCEIIVESKVDGEHGLNLAIKDNTNYYLIDGTSKSFIGKYLIPPAKLLSIDISREKNKFPLRRLVPFTADLSFEVENLSEKDLVTFCNQLKLIPESNFSTKGFKVVDYKQNILRLEMTGESKNTGDQTLKIVLENNENNFKLIENENKYFRGIFLERIPDCSQYFGARDVPAKEFDEGVEFAECVNSWEINKDLEDSTQLTALERNVPQSNFKSFNNFLYSSEEPKSLFNWFLGVLSVKPQDGFRPYLAVFQHGCMNYLFALFKEQNPLFSYFYGLNQNINSLSRDILNNPSSMLKDTGLEKILETDFLIEKKKFKTVQCKKNRFFYRGKDSYTLQEEAKEYCSTGLENITRVWIYNSSKLTKIPIISNYSVEQINYSLNDYFCVEVANYFPADSISFYTTMWGHDCNNCKEYSTGHDYWELFRQTQHTEVSYKNMANLIYENIMQDYDNRPEPYTKNCGYIDLLGIVTNEEEKKLWFNHLGNTSMENGAININLPASNIQYLYPGGFLIYAYDRTNRQFGVLTDLNHPIFENGYVKANALFQPLD